MNKRNILILTIATAAGALCALETTRRKRKRAKGNAKDFATMSDLKDERNSTTSRVDKGSVQDPSESAASMGKIEDGKAVVSEIDPDIDDRGTDQLAASRILKHVRDNAFDASDEKLALALGRSTEEIEQEIRGESLIDGDVLMKTRALAIQRGLETE
jgi:hypothetical protein